MDIGGYDELNNSVFTLIGDIAMNSSIGIASTWMKLQRQFFIVQPNQRNQVQIQYTLDESVEPIPAQTQLFFLDLLSDRQPLLSFTVKRKECNPGFKLKDGTCACDKSINGILG